MDDVRDYWVSMARDYFENRNPLDNDFAIRSVEEQPLPSRKEQKQTNKFLIEFRH